MHALRRQAVRRVPGPRARSFCYESKQKLAEERRRKERQQQLKEITALQDDSAPAEAKKAGTSNRVPSDGAQNIGSPSQARNHPSSSPPHYSGPLCSDSTQCSSPCSVSISLSRSHCLTLLAPLACHSRQARFRADLAQRRTTRWRSSHRRRSFGQ